MAIATTSSTRVLTVSESQWGVTPGTPTMNVVRVTGESLAYNKQTEVSSAITNDRSRLDIYESAVTASGDLQFELAHTDYDTFVASALQNSIVEETISSVSLTFASGGNTITGPANDTFDNLVVGQWIRISGATETENNGVFQVSSIVDDTLTLAGATFTSETTSGATISGKTVVNGKTQGSFSIEKQFEDISQYLLFSGMVINGLSLNVNAGQIVAGSISFNGKTAILSGSTVADTVVDAGSNTPFLAGINVGNIEEGGSSLATAIQSVSLSISNNLREQTAVGSKNPINIASGGIDVTGNLTAYFEDSTLYQKLIGHTASSLSFRLTDGSGNVMVFTLPRVHYVGGNPLAEGVDQDIIVPLEFTATRDTQTGAVIRVDLL